MNRVIVFLCALAISLPVWADGVRVESTISATKISLKDAAQLTLTVRGSKDTIQPVELPKIDGLEWRYIGPSTRISITNGQYSSEHSFVYNVFPTKVGHFEIPALTIMVEGQNYTTQPIEVDVSDAPLEATDSDTSEEQKQSENIKDRMFMTVSSPRGLVYAGEKVPLRIKVYVSALPVRNLQMPKLEKNGFTMDNFPQPQQYPEALNGLKYDVVDFATHIYPSKAGDLSLGPVQIEGSLLYKAQSGNTNGFFSDDFFRNFFDSYQERPLTLNSEPLRIKVLPLPQEGKPADFSGAVGQLDFTASIGPKGVKVGDPVTLNMKISGNANLKSTQMPLFTDSRFKTYDPQIKDEENAKALEQVIVPTSDQITEVPAIKFSYFDPSTGAYKTITQGPFPVKVMAPKPGEEFKAIGFVDLPQATVKPEPVDYVQKYLKAPVQKAMSLVKTPRFWWFVLSLWIVGGGWFLWVKFRERLSRDTAFARRLSASKHAQQGIKQAQEYLRAGKTKEFYDTVFKTVSRYLADHFNRPAGNLTWDEARVLLQEQQIAPEIAEAVKAMYNNCDLVLFAGASADPTRMSEDLVKLQRLITQLKGYNPIAH